MTEHKNIPLPEGDNAKESSLFERASGAFGFDPFKAAPIKGKLPEREMKRAKVRRKGTAEAELPATAVAPQAVSSAAPSPIQSAAPVPAGHRMPVPYEPAPVPQETLPVPVAPSELIVEQDFGAVALSGKKYKVKREHLRDQGLIVPEGTVTALMEEFRIVKRQILKAVRKARESGSGQLAQRVLVCDENLRTGEWTVYYSDGQVKESGRYVDGLREGRWEFYDDLGQPTVRTHAA